MNPKAYGWTRWALWGCAAVALGAATRAHGAPAQAALVASGGAVTAAQGRGVVGDLALRYPLGQHWGVQVVGRSGWLQAQTPCESTGGRQRCSSQGQLALLVGPTWIAPWGERTLHASVLLAHVHHTATADWRARPLANAAGDSSGDVRHRNGGEVRIGVTSAPWLTTAGWALAGEINVIASALPSSELLAWAAGVQLGLAVTRRPVLALAAVTL